MIRPTSLIRGDEPHTPQFEANANNIRHESLDCGITAINCCNTPGCQKLGTAKLFLIILIFLGIFQGAAERYFLISVRLAALQFGYHPVLVDWLLVTSGIIQGVFAIFVAYWGNRIHRISWLGGIIIIQAVSCLVVIIPTITHASNTDTLMALEINTLCTERTTAALVEEQPYSLTTLICLFILQIGIAFGNIVFYTFGLSYIDDNVQDHESPALLGAALAGKLWGVQLGSAIGLGVGETSLGWWLGWTIIGPILFILAAIISLFPKKLLSSVVRQAADNIIERATNNSQLSLAPNKLLADISFGNSMKRMLTNKILVFNVIAAVFIETAIVNFFFHEHSYLQSRFHVPADAANGLDNVWTSRLLTNLLKPPLVALSVLVAGLIIAKANPNPRKLAAWNVITATIVALLFVVFIFIDCSQTQIAGAYNGQLTVPFCSHNCICDANIRFHPVCPSESYRTYYSPCHAGCSTDLSINGQRVFGNCTCGIDTEITISNAVATEGSCGYVDCQKYWIIFQALTVFGASLLASGLIGNLLISIRSVLPQDKSLALSMELWLFGIIVYIPGKIVYRHIADSNCQYFSPDNYTCYLHESPLFGNILNIVTATLIGIGVIFDIFVFIFVKDMVLYGEEPEDAYRPIQMQSLNNPNNNNTTNINNNRYDDISEYPDNGAFGVEQQTQPFLDSRNATPMINSIQNTQTNYRSMSPISGSTLRMEPSVKQNNPTASGNIYAQIKRTDENSNLDFRLQSPDDKRSDSIPYKSISPMANSKTYTNDINPSVGDSVSNTSDMDSILNIRKLESPVSSLSGIGSGSNSHIVSRSPQGILRTKGFNKSDREISPETNF